MGCVLRTRADVTDTVAAAAAALVDAEPARAPLAQRPHCGDAIRTLLARDAPVETCLVGSRVLHRCEHARRSAKRGADHCRERTPDAGVPGLA